MEWLLFILLLAGSLFPLLRRPRPFQGLNLLLAVTAAAAVGAAVWSNLSQKQAQAKEEQFLKHVPATGRKDGYITSDNCASCHPNEYASWHHSYHRTMTQYASTNTVVADFNNLKLDARGESYLLQKRGDELWVDMPDPDWKAEQSQLRGLKDWTSLTNAPRVQKQVSMVTGSHHLQKFWVASSRGNLQYDLPFTYLVEDKRWVLREDSIVRDPDLPLLVQVWNVNCVKCHTTGPQPRRDLRTGVLNTWVGEMGIACEACHGPAEQHIKLHQRPLERYRTILADEKGDATIVNPERLSSKASSEICGQCHSIKLHLERDWEQSGSQYRPGGDLEKSILVVHPSRPSSLPGLEEALKDSEAVRFFFWPDGMTKITGREFNGMAESPCYERGNLSCISCHSMHKGDRNQQLTEKMRSNEACLQCHETMRNKIEQHTHHAPASPGSLCYNCHMPHTSWGLLKAVRSHKITSPNVQTTLDTGRPNACNLCHLDQSLAWSAKHLSDWYAVKAPKLSEEETSLSAGVHFLLRGDAGQRALMVWSMGWDAARQASGQRWMVPYLAQMLEDPYAMVRYRAARGLQTYPEFSDFKFDYVGALAERLQARRQAGEIWSKMAIAPLDRTGSHILFDASGRLEQERFDGLLRQRDNRSVFLVE
jgi:predicted CXXCH cytochrome family protein